LQLEENTCISYKYFDPKTDIEVSPISGKYMTDNKEVSPFELTCKTILIVK